MRSTLLLVPSAQSVPGSGKEMGEHSCAHHSILQKEGSACSLHPGLPPDTFLEFRKVEVSVFAMVELQQSCPLVNLQ